MTKRITDERLAELVEGWPFTGGSEKHAALTELQARRALDAAMRPMSEAPTEGDPIMVQYGLERREVLWIAGLEAFMFANDETWATTDELDGWWPLPGEEVE